MKGIDMWQKLSKSAMRW